MSMKHEPLRYAHDVGHTDICFSSDGTKFITSGADGDIRIWTLDESEDPIHNCVGEWALALAFLNEHIYVSTNNNDVQILTYPDGTRNGVLERFVAPVNHMAINHKHNYIALACENMQAKLYKFDDNDEKKSQIFDEFRGPVLSIALSPNAEYLAASSGDGKLRVWHIETGTLKNTIDCFPKVNSFANSKILCRIDFEPITGNTLAYPSDNRIVILNTTDFSEKFLLISDQITDRYSIIQYSPCGKYLLGVTETGAFILWDLLMRKSVKYSKHSKSVSICGLMWNPMNNGQIIYTDAEGQLGIINDCLDEITGCDPSVNLGTNIQAEEDDEDDENVISLEKLKQQFGENVDDPEKDNSCDSLSHHSDHSMVIRSKMQIPFIPGSTPSGTDLPRYLCWNHVGIICLYPQSNTIEIEFHDTTFHNSQIISNNPSYTMGTLSNRVVLLGNDHLINVIPLNGNAITNEWTIKTDHTITTISASDQLIIYGMDNYQLNVHTIYGTQRATIMIPGPLIALSSFDDLILIAYHSADLRGNDQCVRLKLIKCYQKFQMDCKDMDLVLSAESQLVWMGFTDKGSPVIVDSAGLLTIYLIQSNLWIPFCDTTKHCEFNEKFFVTSVNESRQTVIGIRCCDRDYPGFKPKPIMSEIVLQPLFAELDTEKSQMEADLFAWSNLNVTGCDKKYKETAIKLFALACRNDFDQRALEFMELLSNSLLIKLAVKYASKSNKKRLLDKLLELANSKQLDDDSVINGMPQESTSAKMNENPVIFKKLSLKKSSTRKLKSNDVSGSSEKLETNTNSTLDLNDSSSISEQSTTNPFLKKSTTDSNLSLTDRLDEIDHLDKKNCSEKRKQPEENNLINPKEKQRRLDRFMFSAK